MIKSQILAKFGQKFATGKEEKNGVLQGIHYASDGSAVVTNRHYLLRIHDAHKFEQPVTLHAKTGQPLEGAYPDTSRIFPPTFTDEITIHEAAMQNALLGAQCAAAAAVKLNKKAPTAQLVVDDGSAYIDVVQETPFPINLSTRISEDAPRKNSKRSLNAEYLATALAVFEAAGVGVKIKLNGQNYPIVLTNDAGIEVLILPYRTGSEK